jgi:hypothetical protein
MTTLHKKRLRLGLAVAALAIVWSCNAPFIPVPPPAVQGGFTSALVSDGNGGQKTVWTATGTVGSEAALAEVFIFNQASGSGVITRAAADGTYRSAPFDGVRGDHIDIHFETTGGEPSASACLVLDEGPQAAICP